MEKTKICPRCHFEKHITLFSKNRVKGDGLDTHCKECRSYYNKNSTRKNRENMYGKSKNELDIILASQQGKCAICEIDFSKTPQIDHNDETGKIRGLLCGKCNSGLGFFNDSKDIIQNALNYISKS